VPLPDISSCAYVRRREWEVGLPLLGRSLPGDFGNALDSIPQRPGHKFNAHVQMWRLATADVVALAEQAD